MLMACTLMSTKSVVTPPCTYVWVGRWVRARAHVGRWVRYVGIASGQRCSAMMHCIDFGGRGKFGIIHIIGLNHKRAS